MSTGEHEWLTDGSVPATMGGAEAQPLDWSSAAGTAGGGSEEHGPRPPLAGPDALELATMRTEWRGLTGEKVRQHLSVSSQAKQFVVLHIRPRVWPAVWVTLSQVGELELPLRTAAAEYHERLGVPEGSDWAGRPGFLAQVPRALFGTVQQLLAHQPEVATYAVVPDHVYTVFHVVHTPMALQPGRPVRPSRNSVRLTPSAYAPAPPGARVVGGASSGVFAIANPGGSSRPGGPTLPTPTEED